MEKEKFNQVKYQNEWLKKNYTKIGVSCRSDFVDEFRNACKALGRTQAQVLKEAMKRTIEEANHK